MLMKANVKEILTIAAIIIIIITTMVITIESKMINNSPLMFTLITIN